MKKVLCTVFYTLLWLAVLLACLFMILRVVIDRPALYHDAYVRMDSAATLGISPDDCTRAIYRLIDYMEGRAEDIQLTVTEFGKTVTMYNQQEIDHMRDVRALYQGFRTFSYAALGAFAVFCALLPLKFKSLRRTVRKSFLYAWAAFGILMLGLGAWVLIDFNSFWTGFHYLFFDNMLWLMDPLLCRMIRICPIELFYGIVVYTFISFILLCGLLPLFAWLLTRKNNRKGDAA